ncbi:MAG: hypothetical protein ACR2OW_13045 [Methyloligellaceae bacterium]
MLMTVLKEPFRRRCIVRIYNHVVFPVFFGIFIVQFVALRLAWAQEPTGEQIRTFVGELYSTVSVVTTRSKTGDDARAVRSNFEKACEALHSELAQQNRLPKDWSVCATLRVDLTDALALLESGRFKSTEGGQILHRRIVNIASTLNECREVLGQLEIKAGK